MDRLRRERERELVRELLGELDHMRLSVIKFRKDDVFIRAAITHNPHWYHRLCQQHLKGRKRFPKPRTIIRRAHVEKALRRFLAGKANGYIYDERIRGVIDEELELRY